MCDGHEQWHCIQPFFVKQVNVRHEAEQRKLAKVFTYSERPTTGHTQFTMFKEQ